MNDPAKINELITTIINIIIIPLLPILSNYIIAFIRKKTAELDSQINDKEISNYIRLAEAAVITSVTAVNQTFVDELKKNNGKLTPEEQKTAFEMAKNKVLSILGDTALKALQEIYKDLDTWLDNRIEYYVNQSKIQPEILSFKAFAE